MTHTGGPRADGSEGGVPVGSLRLADFLADLRAELTDAQLRAAGSELRLGVEEVTVSLDLAVTTGRSASGSGKIGARFWVMNAEVSGTGETSSQQVHTQRLTVTLKPRIEAVSYDEHGRVQLVTTRGLDVDGEVEHGEDFPSPPPPSRPID